MTQTPASGDTLVYKILPAADWQAAVDAGCYAGSQDDARDGFIHLSTAAQLSGTASKFFRGQSGLVLVSFKAGDLGADLRWEPSRGGELFPHLYSDLPTEKALATAPLPLDGDGVPTMPGGLG